MIGIYDFCGHYEWTFDWLQKQGGHGLVRSYWHEAIYEDSQRHATALIVGKGFEGMKEYWGHTLAEEGGDWTTTAKEDVFRIDMHACPSKGFLIRNDLQQYPDYCDHCMGWIGPLMKEAGFVINHAHNHCGQCWWEMRRTEDKQPASAVGELSGKADVRLRPDWKTPETRMDAYDRATDPDHKLPADSAVPAESESR
ncbi:hypothetical protein [Prosthecobacter dejongeii]|uniref:Uncharacterized protein n=1 Tax=Prosthecobacter dejongeii TaxID=48465 RepID=A0A7W7YIA0_9BACT|nr:hypothetical protein [Prosthecobacter dejongeii]MBB5036405.1 hypothetical protein [Prosthecobacter dejongeii]